jgi:hypothetical protein
MPRLDATVWEVGSAGGVGPPGWLGAAASASATTLYAPLSDYHLSPPDLPPEVGDRVRVIAGRSAILSESPISTYTDVLSSSKTRFCSDNEWLATLGLDAQGAAAVIQLFCPFFFDRRVADFTFWWASAAGLADNQLGDGAWFTSSHALAITGYVGVITSSDDQPLVERYTTELPIFSSPWDVLVDLGLESIVTA